MDSHTPRQEEHYGAFVWTEPAMDTMRHDYCLCLRCKGVARRDCPLAAKLLDICTGHDIALAVTRCPDWEERE